MKPDGYPLPWCDALDVPYWKINFAWCLYDQSWGEWQAQKPMDTIIPEIDKRLTARIIEPLPKPVS